MREPVGRTIGQREEPPVDIVAAPAVPASRVASCECWSTPVAANPACPASAHVPASYRRDFGRAQYAERPSVTSRKPLSGPAIVGDATDGLPTRPAHSESHPPVLRPQPVDAVTRPMERNVRPGRIARFLMWLGVFASDDESARFDAIDRDLDFLDAMSRRYAALAPTMPSREVTRRLDTVTMKEGPSA